MGRIGKTIAAQKFYSITRSGRKQLANEAENWERIAWR